MKVSAEPVRAGPGVRQGPRSSWVRTSAAALLSGALLLLGFPGLAGEALAWVGLIPLLLALHRGRPLPSLLAGWLLGLVFFGGILAWTLAPWFGPGPRRGVHPIHYAAVIAYSALYTGLFALGAAWLQARLPAWSTLSLPALWVALEYLRSSPGFQALPLGVLGYSQYRLLPVAAIAAFTGVHGVSFLIVALNAGLAQLARALLSHGPRIGVAERAALAQLSALLLIAALGWLSLPAPLPGAPTLRVAVVQADVYEFGSRDQARRHAVFDGYARLSVEAARDGADLIVWPSSSVPARLPADATAVQAVSELARRTGTHLLVGSSGQDKLAPAPGPPHFSANSAFLFSPEGRPLGRADKVRLLPFDEYLPLRGRVPWPSWLVADVTDARAGRPVLLETDAGDRFGVVICWEAFFPGAVRRVASLGADFLVSQTNEAFTRVAFAHDQMLAINVFRAIESGLAVVRAATTGVSAIIDPRGRILTRVEDEHESELDVEGYAAADVPVSRLSTLYLRHGDWFIAVIFAALATFLLRARSARR